MNRAWIALVGTGVLIMVLVAGWELFLILSGTRSEFQLNITPIGGSLYGDVENHFRTDPNFVQFEEPAPEEPAF